MTNNLGLYIHVPFCASKCPYCDFYSERRKDGEADYVNAVIDEINTLRRSGDFVSDEIYSRVPSSVYFGGGTPSLLGQENIARILTAIRKKWTLSGDAEITVECNPSLSDPGVFFEGIKKAGVNRVSIGMQSAVDGERRALGRRAGAEDVKRSVLTAKNAGIENISLDIMLGIPKQTPESLQYSLDFALRLGITHLSVYILKLEEGTVFYKRQNALDLPDEDAVADLYLFTCKYLRDNGMRHYEVSNFCFDDKIGRHNMRYWEQKEYLGIGPAAHSFVNGKRFFCERSLDAFLAGAPALFDGPGGDRDEKIMLALRTDHGADVSEMKNKSKIMQELRNAGYVRIRDGRLTLTDTGFLLSNSVIAALL